MMKIIMFSDFIDKFGEKKRKMLNFVKKYVDMRN